MSMVHQGLSPGVQDSDEPDLCPQVFWIFSKLREGFGSRLEEEVINDPLIPQSQGSDPFGKGEDRVEVESR